MMSKADDTAKKVCDAMVAEHAKRAEDFQSGEVDKYRLNDTVWVEQHHKHVLSRHRQPSWYIPGVILRETGQDVYVIQVGNSKTVERDHTQLLPRETDPHGRAVTFEFTADTFDSDNDGEEDEYTAERILSDKPDPSTPGGRPYKLFCCIEGLVGCSKQLCAAVHVRVVGLPQSQRNPVGCQRCAGSLGHGRPILRPSLLRHIFVNPHVCISFFCRSDACAKARNLPSTPHPNLIIRKKCFFNASGSTLVV